MEIVLFICLFSEYYRKTVDLEGFIVPFVSWFFDGVYNICISRKIYDFI